MLFHYGMLEIILLNALSLCGCLKSVQPSVCTKIILLCIFYRSYFQLNPCAYLLLLPILLASLV